MALSDRDYARYQPPPRGRSGVGRMPVLSVNTWIIIVNAAVFIIGNVLFGNLQTDITAGRFATVPGISAQQLDSATPEPAETYLFPESPGLMKMWYHPLYAGNPKVLIGGERFMRLPIVEAYGHFSSGKAIRLQVWRFITFQFLHADITHIVFNMLGLWFVGSLVEEYLGGRRYLCFYLLCGIFGAFSYLLLNVLGYYVLLQAPQLRNEVPALLFDDIYTPLIGASAGVFGVLMAAAYIAPTALVDVMFILPMKLRTAVYIFLAIAAVNLFRGGQNAGGDAAHVGGALAGAFFIRRAHLLRGFPFDILDRFLPGPRRPGSAQPRAAVLEVNRILDKVKVSGLDSLTAAERLTLQRASEAARS